MDISKGTYWSKKCLSSKNVSINWKCVYLMKIRLLNENVLIEWKVAYWLKMKNEKAQLFDIFKCIYDINLYSYVTQWEVVYKKPNIFLFMLHKCMLKKDIRT